MPEELDKLTPDYMARMTKKGGVVPTHRVFELVDELLASRAALIQALDALCVALRRDFLAGLETELDRRKKQRNVQGFDDLLKAMRRAVDNPTLVQAARSQYQAALIDEFQDTDSLQYAIFFRLFGQDHRLFLIGDPKQAIYSFRGADLATYLRAGRQCDRGLTLGTNFRSTPELIQAVNAVFGAWANPFRDPGIGYHDVGWPDKDFIRLTEDDQPAPALTIWHARAWTEKPLAKGKAAPRIRAAVTAEISRLLTGAAQGRIRLGGRALLPGDIAILVETHRQGDALHRALRDQNIHSVLAHSASVFESAEARDLLAVLRAVAEYQRPALVRTALATRILGLDADRLRRLDEDGPAQDQWVERLAAWHGLWLRQGVMAAMGRMLAETSARARLLAQPGGERCMTNILHCLEILHGRERETRASMGALTIWFARQLASNRREEFQLRLDSDRDAVRIVTIHKSKGLEYPVVFCPFLYKEAKTDPGQALAHEDGLVLDLGSDRLEERQRAARGEAQAELIRLTYVALTRAACRCYLVWGRFNKSETSGPAWLFHGHRADEAGNLVWKDISEDDVRADLDGLAGPELDVADLPDLVPTPVPDHTEERDTLAPRPWTRTLGPGFGLASFSGLTRGLAHALPPGLDEADAPGDQPEDMTVARFPRGATAGSCLHRIFELVDFARPATIAPAVRQGLGQFGLDQSWSPVVETMVNHVLAADLDGFSLKDIGPADRMVELEFLFPLRPVTPETLASAYRDAAHVLPPELPTRMDSLRFEPRQGFMTGFMDLVVRSQGRFYLLDWKSNWLGPTPGHYTRDALEQAMAENHYFLQYHLYCLALDRYLARRLPDYDFTRDFGGVRYVFLRGVHPDHPGRGVFADRPDAAFLRRLGQTLFPESQKEA